MLIPLGFLAGSGGGVDFDYELIESTILTSDTASVTFSSLGTYSSTYKHLQIRLIARGANTGSNRDILLRLNGDSGSNYSHHRLRGANTTVSSSASTSTTSILSGFTSSSGSPANIFGASIIDILDSFSSTKNKTVRVLSGKAEASVSSYIGLYSGQRINTASTTQIEILNDSGNWLTGSRFSLYGIKG
jgi:hypothetical protein